MTAVAADYDNDGWPDIYVACDSTPSWLFRNQHDGTFRQEGLERGAALSEDGLEQAGMGVAVGDYDLDGSLDIFKTHFADDTNVLYHNDGKGHFDDVTVRAGIGVETRYVGWGAGMADFDNDGFPDIFLVTGSVYPEVERTLPAYPFRTPRLLFRQPRRRPVRRAHRGSGQRRGRGAHQSRLCLRRLRQRRRRRRPRDEHERAAVAAAQRRLRQRSLVEGSPRRGQVESQRHRRASDCALRWPDADAGRQRAIELLFSERPAIALRSRRRQARRSDYPLAQMG